MNPRHMAFCLNYVKNGGKGQQAAIAAGFTAKNAGSQASRLLRKAEIKAEIDKLIKSVAPEYLVDHKFVIERLKRIIDHCMLMDTDPGSKGLDDDGDMVEPSRYDASGANKALELIGRHLKMFTDKLEVTDTTDRAALLAEARKRADEMKDAKPDTTKP